jgi:N-acetylneuraminic acid mutarotase
MNERPVIFITIALLLALPVSFHGSSETIQHQGWSGGNYSSISNLTISLSDGSLSLPLHEVGLSNWTTEDMQIGRSLMGVESVGDCIYVIGGYNSTVDVRVRVDEYNTTSGVWRTRSSMTVPRNGMATAVVDNKIYVIGGRDSGSNTNATEVYDPFTDSWESKAPVPTARYLSAASSVGHKIYVIGGGGTGIMNVTEVYDTVTDTWATASPMPTNRWAHTMSAVGDEIYVIGGSNSGILDTVEAYNTTTDSWHSRAPMPTARRDLASAVLGSSIYVVGGHDGSHLDAVERYNVRMDNWTAIQPISIARMRLGAASIDGQIYAVGGRDGSSEGLDRIDTIGLEYAHALDGFLLSNPVNFSGEVNTTEVSFDADVPPGTEVNVTLDDLNYTISLRTTDNQTTPIVRSITINYTLVETPVDSDGDGVPDDEDEFPNNGSEWNDTDSDGVGDNSDPCPNDPLDKCDDPPPPPPLNFTDVLGTPYNTSYLLEFQVRSNECYATGTNYYSNEIGPGNWLHRYNYSDLESNTTYVFSVRCVANYNSSVEGWLNHTGTTLADPEPDPPDPPVNQSWDPYVEWIHTEYGNDTMWFNYLANETVYTTPIVPLHSHEWLTFDQLSYQLTVTNLEPNTTYSFMIWFYNEHNGSTTLWENFTTRGVVSPWDGDDEGNHTQSEDDPGLSISWWMVVLAPLVPLLIAVSSRSRNLKMDVKGEKKWKDLPKMKDIKAIGDWQMAMHGLDQGDDLEEFEESPLRSPPADTLRSIRARTIPSICEDNRPLLEEVLALEKQLRQERDDGMIGNKVYERIIRDVKETKSALQNLTPLMERKEWDI